MEATPINNENIFLCRKANVWYTMMDGDWSNPNVWMGNVYDKKYITTPQPGDTVYLNHNITYDQPTLILKDVNINGELIFLTGSYNLIVVGNLQCIGTLDMSAGAGSLTLVGYNNSIATFISSTLSTFNYAGLFDQVVIGLNYNNLGVYPGNNYTQSRKYLIGNTIIKGSLSVLGDIFDLMSYSLTVLGNTTIGSGGYLLKSTNIGLSLFVGNVYINVNSGWDFRGNGNVEFRSGFTWGNDDFSYFYTGTGTYTFSTNNQTISRSYPYQTVSTFYCSIVIAGITLTLGDGSNSVYINLAGYGNGADGTNNNSKLVVYNATVLQNSLTFPMSTFGIYDFAITGKVLSAIGLIINTDYTLPNITYPGLILGGSGRATAISNITATGVSVYSYLELGSFNLNTSEGGLYLGTGATFSKTGAGSLLFGGLCNFGLNAIVSLTGNPSIEFRGGVMFANNGNTDVNTRLGTGAISFTTNNQSITVGYPGAGYKFLNNVTIAGISLTIAATSDGTSADIGFAGTVNGTNANSYLIVNASNILRFANSMAPMIIGGLIANLLSTTFYELNGNQDIKGGNYGNLGLNTGGVKRLLGNVSVKNTYTLSAPATLNTNGFTLSNP
jgi:hypothetical protein